MRAGGPCVKCGRNPAAGYASIWTAATGKQWYCHGDDDETPTCYESGNWLKSVRQPPATP